MDSQLGPYKKLLQRADEIALVTGAAEALNWDSETYMPAKALEFRARQLAHLGGEAHRLFTAKKVGEWIAECEQHGFAPDSPEAANVREWRRRYDRATRIPARLVEKFERTRALARQAWKEARAQSKFKLFQGDLKKVLVLNRQRAELWGFEDSPYDALLDEYEPGMRVAHLRAFFGELRPAILSVLGPAIERSASVPANILEGDYPVLAQEALAKRAAQAIGFEFQAGRLDTTTHPFCNTLGLGDCRLTTRYSPTNLMPSFYGVLHEAGHGLYEQGLPPEHFGTPLGTAVSLGVHESQSRLWENHVGRHPAFWEYWLPIAADYFPHLKRFSPEQMFAAVNRVAPSFIRTEADQVTYDLHIILRFEIELKLIQGELKVADVPGCWNEEFEKMFGLKVPNDAAGCLQDIHWSIGNQGYFPTYSLGNLNAAQLFQAARRELPTLESDLARGQYHGLLGWLRGKVHSHGSYYQPQELIRRATGQPTSTAPHIEYLRAKFGPPQPAASAPQP